MHIFIQYTFSHSTLNSTSIHIHSFNQAWHTIPCSSFQSCNTHFLLKQTFYFQNISFTNQTLIVKSIFHFQIKHFISKHSFHFKQTFHFHNNHFISKTNTHSQIKQAVSIQVQVNFKSMNISLFEKQLSKSTFHTSLRAYKTFVKTIAPFAHNQKHLFLRARQAY